MAKRRTLADLYMVESEVIKFSDKRGDIQVVLRKINDVEGEDCTRAGNAARAVFLIGRQDHDSELWRSMYTEVMDVTKDGAATDNMVTYLVQAELTKKRSEMAAEIEGDKDKRWKDGYYQGLIDTWGDLKAGTMAAEFSKLTDEGSPIPDDIQKVFDELSAYLAEVEAAVEAERSELSEVYEMRTSQQLVGDMVDSFIDAASNATFWNAFNLRMLYYATRWADAPDERHFDNFEAVLRMPPKARKRLLAVYAALEVGDHEGKDLPETPGSSSPSESPELVGTTS